MLRKFSEVEKTFSASTLSNKSLGKRRETFLELREIENPLC